MSVFIILVLAFFSINVFAESDLAKDNIKINANNINSIDNNVFELSGGVKMQTWDSEIKTDTVIYKKDVGEVESNGKFNAENKNYGKISGESFKITENLTILDLYKGKLIKPDNSMIFFNRLNSHKGNNILKISKSKIYVCPSINDNPNNMISLTSSSVQIDKTKNKMIIKNAILKIKGVPILYIPYYVGPFGDRKTGFLTPSYFVNTQFGAGVNIPFYWNISDNKDMLITATPFIKNQNYLIEAKYRQITEKSDLEINLGYANDKNVFEGKKTISYRQDRGIINTIGKTILKNDWSAKYQIAMTSDKDFLRDYKNDFTAYLQSHVTLEKFNEHNFYQARSVYFRELLESHKSDTSPTVLPMLTHRYSDSKIIGESKKTKVSFGVDTSMTSIAPFSGIQYRRLSSKPYITSNYNLYGNIFELYAESLNNIYSLDDRGVANNINTTDHRYKKSYVNSIETVIASWKLPLSSKIKQSILIVTPIVQAINTTQTGDNNLIYGQDYNPQTELTVINLFKNDRVTGLDRFEVGNRVNYGINSSVVSKKSRFEWRLGQGYRDNHNVAIYNFKQKISDIVTRVSYDYLGYIESYYNLTIDKDTYKSKLEEINFSVGNDKYRLGNLYTKAVDDANIDKVLQKQTTAYIRMQPGRFGINANVSYDLLQKSQWVRRGLDFSYNGCCVVSGFAITQQKLLARNQILNSIYFFVNVKTDNFTK